MPRWLRHLRIAFSVACGIACVLLAMLWVRSYWRHTTDELLVTAKHRYYLHSLDGTVAIQRQRRIFFGYEATLRYDDSFYESLKTQAGLKISADDGLFYSVSVSYWLLLVAVVCSGTIPWLPWRFSLRTLLIATTLIAVVLGAIAYAAK